MRETGASVCNTSDVPLTFISVVTPAAAGYQPILLEKPLALSADAD